MSEITNTTVGGLMSAAANSGQTGSLQQLGKDDFLQLLVTKLQNQDPLNPMEDEDFIAQLAQFSSLEQMTNIAEGIAESNKWDYLQMQSINNVMAAGLIGKEVEASYDTIYFDGSKEPSLTITTDRFVASVEIKITNADGEVVATLTDENLASGKHTFTWDGTDAQGNRVPEGSYAVAVRAVDGAGAEYTPKLGMRGVVEAVTYRDGAAYFRVDGMEIPFGDVAAIAEEGQLGGE
ncbi:MAG TPA: flagellar hook assembly protein FlgD [candidate division Zixibacteria bacterium]|nr:flagellar hook assembly protein FlgD [candidate division Zixibacteria bacterium]MDD4916812.1 flagellar hook assembly protein FlgD [candidate division Zixibacteria bacterium]MDM7973413.1 flagellar hook assembly protein FlgD [candidate division Zixibacteria bacterium]HOZ06708.1 flagellar hook assembly protein FlgD [candidate division Zixibacteria bacterium]HPI33407.1 flagellar hook assembly protein FlgD [candidate division Zixibacteria bacterium]